MHSIATGVTANETVNADTAKDVGYNILKSMVGKDVHKISFKRKEHVVTLSNTTVQIDRETVDIDPQLLFQRLVSIRDRYADTEELFKHELSSYSAVLFDTSLLPREAHKPELASALWGKIDSLEAGLGGDDIQYVIDGEALIQRIPWKHGDTFDSIFERYVTYVSSRYKKAVVVFGGYEEGPSTKDSTH